MIHSLLLRVVQSKLHTVIYDRMEAYTIASSLCTPMVALLTNDELDAAYGGHTEEEVGEAIAKAYLITLQQPAV